MEYYTLMDHVYEFSKVELRHIYCYYNSPNLGPNGEGLFGDYAGGYYLGSRMGRTRWIYPVAETAILIYSEDVRFYVISTVDFTQSVSISDPYTGEPGYIPCKFFGKGDDNAGMPERQPGKPRYYDMPLADQVRLQLEHRFPDYYAPVKPTPEPPDGVGDDAFVVIKSSGFEPKTITVPVGTIVGWKNDDDSDQTVTSTGATRLFDSGSLNPRAAFTYLFSEPGEYPYISQTSGFTGTVIVTGGDSPTPTEPIPEPTTPEPTPEPTVTVEPTLEPTSEPEPTMTAETPVEPIPTESAVPSEETPVVEPEPEEFSTFTSEPTVEPIEEQTPVEDENETG
jgi:plastocyanin